MKLQHFIFTGLVFTVPWFLQVRANGEIDRIEILEGAILTGQIEELTDTHIQLKTAYAGTLVVDRSSVVRIQRAGEKQAETKSTPPQKAPVVAAEGKKTAGLNTDPSAERKIWAFEAGLNFTGRQGNTDKMDLAITADVEMDRNYDRLGIYGRYRYGNNRSKLTANEIILGSQYTNFFYESLGFFFREELEHDDFEGILVRSTTASGISWKVRDEKDLMVETRSGLSYRFEDYEDDGSEDFPGMDFGLDLNWRFAEWGRFKGSYTYLPSVADFEDYILRQDSGFNFPLDYSELWQLRLGVTSKYNNQPDLGKEKMDHHYYARLIAAWK